MIITVTSFKGGVGKTTTAIHLACYLQRAGGSVLLVDGDPNRSCLAWNKRGGGKLPFTVVDEKAAMRHVRDHEHVVIDTAARPDRDELKALSEGCDLLVLPTTPEAMALDALSQTVTTLKSMGIEKYKVLLTIVPPKPSTDGEQSRVMLEGTGLRLFSSSIKRLTAFQRASLLGIPVYDVKDKYAAESWDEYAAVGKEMVNG
jgi:chromosome partitioning protein